MPRWRWGDATAPLLASLDGGGIVAFPTESTYALGVDPWSKSGVEAIYRAKGRPRDKALPVVVAKFEDLERLGVAVDLPILAPVLERLAALWPAAVTAVLPLRGRPESQVAASGGTGTLAIRVPDHERLRELLCAVGPLTATSANPSGSSPATTADEVDSWFGLMAGGESNWIVEDGPLSGGPPSTIVAFEDGKIRVLRQGRVAWADVEAALAD